MGRPRLMLTPATCKILLAYDWPGNVRELNNEMERAASLTFGTRVEPSDLSPRILKNVTFSSAEEPPLPVSTTSPEADSLQSSPGELSALSASRPETLNLQEVERHLICEALAQTGGNKSKAAELLGITREGLRKKLLRLGMADSQ